MPPGRWSAYRRDRPAGADSARVAEQDGHYVLLADPLVLDPLGLKTGDLARLGTARCGGRRADHSRPRRETRAANWLLMAAAFLFSTGRRGHRGFR